MAATRVRHAGWRPRATDGRIWGCYLHGLFANAGFRRAWLASLGHAASTQEEDAFEASLNRLADAVEAPALDMPRLDAIIGL